MTSDENINALIRLLHERSAKGVATYGVTTDAAGLSELEWIDHAIEEALDLAIYLMAMRKRRLGQ